MTKASLIDFLKKEITEKIEAVLSELNGIQKAKASETKSSAGDKYETSREMMRFEEEKANTQLSKLRQQLHQLKQINPTQTHDTIQFGSLVVTSESTFLMGIPVGKVNFQDQEVFAISLASPMGQNFLKKQVGDEISMNNLTYKITEIN
ncbi:MAG: hypothetical protein MK078_01880 [Crocinitomicaceae bacterium]|nr:hypothetical protein [Crocinitomicaceae bacterium]